MCTDLNRKVDILRKDYESMMDEQSCVDRSCLVLTSRKNFHFEIIRPLEVPIEVDLF